MEAVQAGWLSILPPVVAIILAIITKDVVFSLLLGALSGTLIYSMLAGMNPLIGPIEVLFKATLDGIDVYIILFICLLGALVQVIANSGASAAYGRWGSKTLKTRRSTLLATSVLGVLIFIDDYFNCLTVGTVMRPLSDRQKISRAKLAYIIDSTAAPVCILAPISSWAAAVGSNLRTTGAFTSDFSAFCSTIPYNLYALLTIAMVVYLSVSGRDFGPMGKQELLARELEYIKEEAREDNLPNGRVSDMIVPILALIVLTILGMLYNGGFFTPGDCHLSVTGALGNCNAAEALTWGGLSALILAFLMFVPRKLMSFKVFMEGVTEGMKNMVPSCSILILAWTISGVCRDQLLTAEYIRDLMAASSIPGALLPVLIFIVAAFLSFSTGTAWGTFGILIPIVIPVATALSPNLLVVALAATLSGSVFGDHCSPISDTTILSSTGAECDHMVHVSTQLPYALCSAGCAALGYIASGLTDGNLAVTLGVSFVSLAVLLLFVTRKSRKEV
ncbi:MAG: Na+/H+ antiporter NhaC family protein [Oscillospiraceae bacterium]|nr:Na+/H+ antiporter NhaC family protein [Oscillospiraceae bacterium]